jgi:hypothetical protein
MSQEEPARPEDQGELFTGGDLNALPWAAIITSRKTADELEAQGDIEWNGDHYRFANEPRQEATPEWMASIGARLETLRLDPFDYRVLAHLIWRAGGRGTCWPTYDQIAEATLVSRRRIAMSLANLRARGVIRIKTGHEGRANEYEIRSDLVADPVESASYHEDQCTTCTHGPENRAETRFPTQNQCTSCTPTLQQYNTPTDIGVEGDLFGGETPSTSHNRELFAFFLPATLSANTEVMLALGEFEKDRRERRKKMTRAAIKILCTKISSWKPEQIVQACKAAIENSWTTVYLPREDAPKAQTAPPTPQEQNYGAWGDSTAK